MIRRGAIELRENLTMGQAIASYNVTVSSDGGQTWSPLPLRNGGGLTIGNRRIQYWDLQSGSSLWGGDAGVAEPQPPSKPPKQPKVTLKLEVATLQLASGEFASPHLRSVRVMDWTSPTLDPMLAYILKVP
jgi:hypothetical protein